MTELVPSYPRYHRESEYEMNYPDGVRTIDEIEDSGPLVCLTKEVDLDDLLLTLAAGADSYAWNGEGYEEDVPTRIPDAAYGEAQVGWFRKGFCRCMGYHSWDVERVASEKPEGSKACGVFLGVLFS